MLETLLSPFAGLWALSPVAELKVSIAHKGDWIRSFEIIGSEPVALKIDHREISIPDDRSMFGGDDKIVIVNGPVRVTVRYIDEVTRVDIILSGAKDVLEFTELYPCGGAELIFKCRNGSIVYPVSSINEPVAWPVFS